jgi:hypothetical protein
MSTALVRIDLSHAKNALFVRQTVAKAFGIPLDREFTWDILTRLICRPENSDLPEKVYVESCSSMSIRVPHEAKMLKKFFDSLREARPDIQITVRLR